MTDPKDNDVLAVAARVLDGKAQSGDVETLALWAQKQAIWLRQMRDKAGS